MKIYQAHYSYGPEADDSYYYYGSDGDLYINKEDCEKEAKARMTPNSNDPDDIYYDIPINYTIIEIEIKDHYEP